MEIYAEMQLSDQGDVWAHGIVTVENSLRFPVQLRKYKHPETGVESSFLGLPRRFRDGQWSNVITLEEEIKKEIETAVVEAAKKKLLAEVTVPEVIVLDIHAVHPKILPGMKAYICGIASIKCCGIHIHGITIKRSANGLFINMPQYKDHRGYHDVIYGITKEMHEKIQREVLWNYQEHFCMEKTAKEEAEC